jgi:hypothetical protein
MEPDDLSVLAQRAVEDSPRWTRARDENVECSCFFAYGCVHYETTVSKFDVFLGRSR